MTIQQMFLGAAGDNKVYVDDVFSTDLWPGTGLGQDITNGINLATEGGLVWTKNRGTQARHTLTCTDFNKTGTYYDDITSNDDWPIATGRTYGITTFNNDGFSLGGNDSVFNYSPEDYVSWTFRKAPGFLDVVTWQGDGNSTNTLDHDLGSTPGAIFIKRTIMVPSGGSQNWCVWHRSAGVTHLSLDLYTGVPWYNNVTNIGSTTFTVDTNFNYSGSTYVAYVFAHDDEQFGADSDEAIIKCGEYTSNWQSSPSSPQSVNLGWEPQFVIIKQAGGTMNGNSSWFMFDNLRMYNPGSGIDYPIRLWANEDVIEHNATFIQFTSTGFIVDPLWGGPSGINWPANDQHVYIAIKKE